MNNDDPAIKKGRVRSILEELIAKFITENASRESLITVVYLDLNKNNSTVRVFCAILPKEKERTALALLRRKEWECKQYIQKHAALRNAPTVRFFLAKDPVFDW